MYYQPFELVTGQSVRIVDLKDVMYYQPFELVTGRQSARIVDLKMSCTTIHLNWSVDSL